MRVNHQICTRRYRIPKERHGIRKATVAMETAVVLPLLLLLFVASVDFARVFRQMQVIAECARAGAVYGADPDLAARSGFETVESMVLAGAVDLSPTPVVSVVYGTDSHGDKYAEVTVSHSFRPLTNFLGSEPLILSRTARARLRPGALE
ncbi:MAG: TadE/TadG family type IV pilus assembly protein [Planctomycetaceae bacterium]